MILWFAHLLVAYLVLVMPWVGRAKYRRLQQAIAAGSPGARERFYRLSVAQQWLLVAALLLFIRLASLPLQSIGLTAPYSWTETRDLMVGFTVAIGASIVLFRCTGDRFLRRLLKMVGALLPATVRERLWFAVISVGAGISEELLFRGFLLWYLSSFFPPLNAGELIVVSSLIFGFCHIYQGLLGVFGTGVIGAVLAWMYVSTGSLILPIAVHALVDLRILAILTPRRIKALHSEES